MLAHLTHAEWPSSDPGQGPFDRSQETSIRLMQADLKLRFSVGVGLVNEITLPAACSWYKGLGSASRGRQLVQLGE